jgi:hypothetical protein
MLTPKDLARQKIDTLLRAAQEATASQPNANHRVMPQATESKNCSTSLTAFTTWAKSHITGDEKGQAQIFIDRLFQAFGHPGSLDVGGTPEFRVRKPKEDGGGTSFADYVWKPVVLIEMKKRGEKLTRHYRQAFDYWTRLVPGRPRYVVLCNFDEFWVYDFETQMDTPVGKAKLDTLADSYGPLAFLQPGQPSPIFDNDHVAVTREAADKLAACYNKFRARGVAQPLAQRFTLQMLVALFAEDIGLLEKYFVARLLDECTDDTAFDLLGGLFTAMNTPAGTPGGRFRGVPYFNGGLFAEPARIELTGPEIVLLRECAKSDWSKVQPEIFGAVFEHTLGDKERHASGAHFTHPADIMKIVGPTIVEPWREQIESAKTAKRLGELLHRIQHFRVLDPACGSGNFLYIAYRELKRLEARIYEKLEGYSSKAEGGQMRMSYLSAQNFFGLDINPFAVELAKVTMMIARKLAIDELHITEPALPLDNLDKQFRCGDALLSTGPDGATVRAAWPEADVIIGNPPFHGAKTMKPKLGLDYVNLLRKTYPEVPGMADFCVYWIRRSHDHLPACTPADPVAGRIGLVGTQNIRNNSSRIGGLDHVVKDGTIIEAVDNQPWSGEANVHVSIPNWVKTKNKLLVPAKCRLWSKVETKVGKPRKKHATGLASKEYDLSYRDVSEISASLSDQTDVSGAVRLICNFEPQVCFSGQIPRHHGFVLEPSEASALLEKDPASRAVVLPFLIGAEMLTHVTPRRWVVDFQKMDILSARRYSAPFAHIETHVLPHIKALADAERKESGKDTGQDQQWLTTWWQHFRCRKELVDAVSLLPRYIACSDTTKRPVFAFISSIIRPDHKLRVFAFSDDYSFGILQSHAHWLWFVTKCSKLKSDFNYTSSTVFDTFPWPQSPAKKAMLAVAEAGREVRRIRDETLPTVKGGLRELYRTLELPGANPLKDAHATLDAAVLAAYGFHPGKDLLAQLLALNQALAARIEKGEPVTAPGLPLDGKDRLGYITRDCIMPVTP